MTGSSPPAADNPSAPAGAASGTLPDADLDSAAPAPVHVGPVVRAAYWIGSVGLLVAAAADAIAVLGRHIGVALLGSIEIVQTAVVLIASTSMVAATILKAHASVHIVTERLSKRAATFLARVADLLGALVFTVLAVGSVWIAAELWNGFERTELLGVPLRWLRALWIAATVLIIVLFVRSALRRSR